MTQDVTLIKCRKSPFSFFSAQKSIHTEEKQQNLVSLYVSGKLPTYPSPKPALTLISHLGQNVGLREG